MRRSVPFLVATGLLLGTLACRTADRTQEPRQTAVDSASLHSAVKELHVAYRQAVEMNQYRGDLGYASDAVVYPAMMPPIAGVDSIRAAIRRYYSDRDATMEIETRELQPLAPGWAYEIGTITERATTDGADQPAVTTSTYFAILRRTDDGWRYYREATNLNHPPKSMPRE